MAVQVGSVNFSMLQKHCVGREHDWYKQRETASECKKINLTVSCTEGNRALSTSPLPTVSPRTVLSRVWDHKKAKRVFLYHNGDKFFKGMPCPINNDKFRTFDSLLSEFTRLLSDKVNLPCGVRYLYTLDGQKVTEIDQIQNGKGYVCSSSDGFKKIDYTGTLPPPSRRKKSGEDSSENSSTSPVVMTAASSVENNTSKDFIRPRIIIVIRSGVKPRKVKRFLLNKKTAHSLEQVFNDITNVIQLDSGAVRKMYMLNRRQVTSLADFFQADEVFIAYGYEKSNPCDFDLDPEECRFIYKSSPAERRARRLSRFNGSFPGSGNLSSPIYGNRTIPRIVSEEKRKSKSSNYSTDNVWPKAIQSKLIMGKVIGEGNFAVVREASCRVTGSRFAVKIIDKNKCRGNESMIENEVAIMRKVKHPNIIELIDEYYFPNDIYLVMELVKGGDLFDEIALVSKYSENDARLMISDLAAALDYLHYQDIVHRDIKPENLLVAFCERKGRMLKLGDFGLAKVVAEPLFTVCGTPTYVAPEILAETGYGLKVDIWAMGVITYILLCGFPPFISHDNDQEELFDFILRGEYEFLSPYWDDISDDAKNLIDSMLQVDIDQRITSKQVLRHPWITLNIRQERSLSTSSNMRSQSLVFNRPFPHSDSSICENSNVSS